MSIVAISIVRIGVEVTRNDSKWVPFDYRLFHCRQGDHPPDNCVRSWAEGAVELLGVCGGLPGQGKLKVGDSARYWATLRLIGTRDYWGEYDDEIEVIKCRRIR